MASRANRPAPAARVNTAVAGMRVKARPVNEASYLQWLGNGVKDFAQTTLSSLRNTYLGTNAPPVSAVDSREKVLWCSFQKMDRGVVYESSGHGQCQVLMIIYVNGWQLWDVSLERMVEIASKRDGMYKFARVLPSPSLNQCTKDEFAQARPIIALVTEPKTEHKDHKVVLHSLRKHESVKDITSKYRIHGVLANRRVLVVTTRRHTIVFSAASFSILHRVPDVYETPSGCLNVNPTALGDRWLATTFGKPLVRQESVESTSISKAAHRPEFTRRIFAPFDGDDDESTAIDQAAKVGRAVTKIGETGIIAVSNILNLRKSGPAFPASDPINDLNPDTYLGNVAIRDAVTGQCMLICGAMHHPITAMAFDESGTLLVTASVLGHGFSVFTLAPPKRHLSTAEQDVDGIHMRMLYRLRRGITTAIVQDICFTPDSRWVAVTSTHGTTHMYSINVRGGLPTPSSHCTDLIKNIDHGGIDQLSRRPPPCITLPALSRLKQPARVLDAEDLKLVAYAKVVEPLSGSVPRPIPLGGRGDLRSGLTYRARRLAHNVVPVACVFISSAKPSQPQLLVASHTGSVLRYDFVPLAVDSNGATSNGLLSMISTHPTSLPPRLGIRSAPVSVWEIGRHQSWPQVNTNLDLLLGPTATNGGFNHSPSSQRRQPKVVGEVAGPLVKQQGFNAWLRNTEIETHPASTRPLYMGPQFSFRVYKVPLNAELNPLMDDDIGGSHLSHPRQIQSDAIIPETQPLNPAQLNDLNAALHNGSEDPDAYENQLFHTADSMFPTSNHSAPTSPMAMHDPFGLPVVDPLINFTETDDQFGYTGAYPEGLDMSRHFSVEAPHYQPELDSDSSDLNPLPSPETRQEMFQHERELAWQLQVERDNEASTHTESEEIDQQIFVTDHAHDSSRATSDEELPEPTVTSDSAPLKFHPNMFNNFGEAEDSGEDAEELPRVDSGLVNGHHHHHHEHKHFNGTAEQFVDDDDDDDDDDFEGEHDGEAEEEEEEEDEDNFAELEDEAEEEEEDE